MSSYEDKRRLNMIYLDPDTHAWIVEQANNRGMSLAEFAGAVLDEVREEWTFPDKDDLRRSKWNAMRGRYLLQAADHARQIAAMYVNCPTEEMADLLQDQCELAELDYAEVLDSADGDPFSSIIASTRNGSKFGKAIPWLIRELRREDIEHGKKAGRAPVVWLEARGDETGYNMSLLNRVKRVINRDTKTPRIVSEKVGSAWDWVLRDVEDDQER